MLMEFPGLACTELAQEGGADGMRTLPMLLAPILASFCANPISARLSQDGCPNGAPISKGRSDPLLGP
jgi:hypothetical protein